MEILKNQINRSDLQQKPIERAETIPSDWYYNPEIELIEKELIFKKEWQLVAHISQIPNPGDSICTQIENEPILIVHADKDDDRAFYNVCKHRGGPMDVKRGTKTVLQCQYHGWTYLMDGSLRGVPQFNKVELFDKKDFGLKPAAMEIWQGLIFISVADEPREFSRVIAGIAERISPVDLSKFKFHQTVEYTIKCNWKLYADNFLEGYHIPIVHPELAKLLDYRNYITEAEEYYSLQYSPFSENSNNNIYKADNGQAYYYFIYPNFMLNILPGRLQTNIIKPVDPETCRVLFHYYYEDPERAKAENIIKEDLNYSEKIQQEDIEICEAVQRGLHSSAYDKGRFSVERELGVYHFQTLLKMSFGDLFKT